MDTEEVVQYIVVNTEVKMSPPKMAVQVSHVALRVERTVEKDETYEEWIANNEKKILLSGKLKDLLKLERMGFPAVRDLGLTEIPPNTLTAVGLPPMTKEKAQQYVKRLQLFKGNEGEKERLILKYQTALERISGRNVSGYDNYEEVIEELQQIATEVL